MMALHLPKASSSSLRGLWLTIMATFLSEKSRSHSNTFALAVSMTKLTMIEETVLSNGVRVVTES